MIQDMLMAQSMPSVQPVPMGPGPQYGGRSHLISVEEFKKKYFDSVLSCFFTRNYQQTCIGDCKRTRYTKYTICIIWFFKVSFKISIFYLFSYLCHFEEIVGTPKI